LAFSIDFACDDDDDDDDDDNSSYSVTDGSYVVTATV